MGNGVLLALGGLLEKETLDRHELRELLHELEPESRASETMGTVRVLP